MFTGKVLSAFRTLYVLLKRYEMRSPSNFKVEWGVIWLILALVSISLAIEFWMGIPQGWVLVLCGVFICFGVVHELIWLRRRRGALVAGVVVGFALDGSGDPDSYMPEIEYTLDNQTRRFLSHYSGPNIEEGKQVNVCVYDNGTKAELYLMPQRIMFTLVPIATGIFGIAAFMNWI